MVIQSIGRYRLLRDLGQGAAAHVYLARDPTSGRQVAVKLLAGAYTADPSFPAHFERALKVLAALDHPYLVPVHDFGREEDQFYVVQRYMPGGTLADRLDGRPMLLAEVVPILQRLSDALDTAHLAGVFHGDFNPAHVLFDVNGRAFITDLGLAPLLQGGGTATQPSLPGLAGTPTSGWERFVTPAYMSPEQVLDEGADSRSDVYALGVMLYEMLTGRQPYVAATPEDVIRQQVEDPVPQLSQALLARLVLPEEFNQVMARALSKQRDLRYPTAGVLAEAMRSVFLMTPAPMPPMSPAAPLEPARFEPEPIAAPPRPPPPTLLAFEPTGREPAEILRSEPPEPPARPRAYLWGLGGIGLVVVIGLLGLARWTNLGGWGLAPTPTATPTATVTQPATATFTATAPPTWTQTPTFTPSPTQTATFTVTPSRTPSPTATTPPTVTPSVTRTRAPTQPAFTRTPTSTSAVAPLPIPVTATATP